MSHHRQTRHLLLILLIAFGSGPAAMGQLTKSVRESVDAKSSRPVIDTFVAAQIKNLSSEDAKIQKNARDLLANEASYPTVSSGFLDEYADSLNAAVLPLANSPDFHVRLSAAIAVARVAAKAGNTRLSGATIAFIKDKNPAVALWGLKAAKYILPSMILGLQAPGPMGQAVIDAAKLHSTGAVAEEAYNTLLLQTDAGGLRGFQPAVLKPYLPIPIGLFEYRVKLYEDFAPPQPLADTLACKFFVNANVWQAMTVPQQRQAQQLMLDLLKGAAKQNAADSKPELVEVIRQTAGAFEVAAGPLKNDPLKKAAHLLSTINNETTAGEIDTRITAVEDAIKSAP